MDRNTLVGDWSLGYREVSVRDEGAALILTCPDAPDGYEGRLVEVDEERLRIEGGPLHGAELVITDHGPALGGRRRLSRLDRPARAPEGSGLTVPPLEPNPEEEEAFEHLWNWTAHPSRAPEVDLGGVDPCRFVQWVSAHDLALFHGSNRIDQAVLQPASWPTPLLGDPGYGDVLVANQDGLCCMFPAVVDEEVSGRGGRHWVERFHSREGTHVDLYHFSLPRQALDGSPFRPGGLYLLPRERFQPTPLYPGGPQSAEWISAEPVRPLACLVVTPDDFPLLSAVGSYD